MELRTNSRYRAVGGIDMLPGTTTEGLPLTEDRKQRMLQDFPHLFEVVGETAPAEVTEDKPAEVTEDKPAEEPKKASRKRAKKAD